MICVVKTNPDKSLSQAEFTSFLTNQEVNEIF